MTLYINKNYYKTTKDYISDLKWPLVVVLSSCGALTYICPGSYSAQVTQVASLTLGFFGCCQFLIDRKIKLKNYEIRNSLWQAEQRLINLSEEKIEAAWKCIQAQPWYLEFLQNVNFPPAELNKVEKKRWNWSRIERSASNDEAWTYFRKRMEKGICAGITEETLDALTLNPYACELEILPKIKKEKAIYYQLDISVISVYKKALLEAQCSLMKERMVLNEGTYLCEFRGISYDEKKYEDLITELNDKENKLCDKLNELNKKREWIESKWMESICSITLNKKSHRNYEKLPISSAMEEYKGYVQGLLRDRTSPNTVIIGKIDLPKHRMAFEIFPNGESRIFDYGFSYSAKNIEKFTKRLKNLSERYKPKTENSLLKNGRSITISALFLHDF